MDEENNGNELDQGSTGGEKPSISEIVAGVAAMCANLSDADKESLQFMQDLQDQACRTSAISEQFQLSAAEAAQFQQNDLFTYAQALGAAEEVRWGGILDSQDVLSDWRQNIAEAAGLGGAAANMSLDGGSALANMRYELAELQVSPLNYGLSESASEMVSALLHHDPIIPPATLINPYPAYHEERSEPIPKMGIECLRFYVTGGTAVQVGTVLNDDFDALITPLCYLVEHISSDCYWHIDIYHGDIIEARECAVAGHSVNSLHDFEVYEEGRKNVERVGYIYISDRPTIQVQFFVFDKTNSEKVIALANNVADKLHESGFKLMNDTQTEPSLPSGAKILDDFDPILFGTTADGLIGLIKSYLQASGYVPESALLEQKLYQQQMYIQYVFAHCIVRFKTSVETIGQIIVKPDICYWEGDPLQREKDVIEAQDHITNLVEALKKETRWIPKKPNSTDSLDPWFDYYHECKRVGYKYGFKEMAKDVNRSEGYIRQLHSNYRAERGI